MAARQCAVSELLIHFMGKRQRTGAVQDAVALTGPRSRARVLDCASPDTVPRVIQPRARRAPRSSPQPSVNNSAAPKMKSSEKLLRSRHVCHGRIALSGSRSACPHPARISQSLPARPAAPVPTSERTKACEAPGIRLTHDGATMQKPKGTRMKSWQEITHYAGFDWAKDHHVVVVVNGQGLLVADFEFEHSLQGWQSFADKT
jgi:hypothetical protein